MRIILISCILIAFAGCSGHRQKPKKNVMAPPENIAEKAQAGEKRCIEEGAMFFVFEEGEEEDRMSCCEGLKPIEKMEVIMIGHGRDQKHACQKPADEAYVCVIECGDGQCTEGENICNCPDDCKTVEPKSESPNSGQQPTQE